MHRAWLSLMRTAKICSRPGDPSSSGTGGSFTRGRRFLGMEKKFGVWAGIGPSEGGGSVSRQTEDHAGGAGDGGA